MFQIGMKSKEVFCGVNNLDDYRDLCRHCLKENSARIMTPSTQKSSGWTQGVLEESLENICFLKSEIKIDIVIFENLTAFHKFTRESIRVHSAHQQGCDQSG